MFPRVSTELRGWRDALAFNYTAILRRLLPVVLWVAAGAVAAQYLAVWVVVLTAACGYLVGLLLELRITGRI